MHTYGSASSRDFSTILTGGRMNGQNEWTSDAFLGCASLRMRNKLESRKRSITSPASQASSSHSPQQTRVGSRSSGWFRKKQCRASVPHAMGLCGSHHDKVPDSFCPRLLLCIQFSALEFMCDTSPDTSSQARNKAVKPSILTMLLFHDASTVKYPCCGLLSIPPDLSSCNHSSQDHWLQVAPCPVWPPG